MRVLVTGGAGHIGSSIVTELHANGLEVIAAGRNSIKSSSGVPRSNYVYLQCDINDSDNRRMVIKELFAKESDCYGLVNNAYDGKSQGGISYSEYELEGVFKNLTSTMLLSQEFANTAIGICKPASIVNIASMYGIVSPDPRIYKSAPELHSSAAYGALKAAIIQFTKYLAVELAPANIRVNSISPGAIPNENVQKNQDFVDALKDKIPLGRIGSPVDISSAASFLLSGKASYITGINLSVDGGWTAW